MVKYKAQMEQNGVKLDMMKMKMALLQALQEAGEIGPEGDQAKIHAAAIGSL